MGMNPALTLMAAGGGAAAWTPASLTTQIAWWDASDAATITSAGSPALVSAWASKVGSYSLVQSTDAKKPTTNSTTINGKNVLAFDGGDGLSVASFAPASTKITVWAVFTAASGGDQVVTELTANYAGASGFLLYRIGASNKTALAISINNFNVWTTTSTHTTTAKLFVGTGDVALATNETAGYVDGASDGSVTTNQNNNSTNFATSTLYVGARAGSSIYLTGNIAEMGICTTVLDATDLDSLHTYIAAKWGTA